MKRTDDRAPRRASRNHRPPAEFLGSLYDSIREGVYIGPLDSDGGTTRGANRHLKLMLGLAPEGPDDRVRPFAADRFVDPRARAAFVAQLRNDGAVSDYLLRLRRVDDSSIWVEVTATLHVADNPDLTRVEALVRDVSERRKLEDQGRDLNHRPVDASTKRGLETILSESERAAKIVRNLLTFARKRNTTRSVVDLNGVIRETLALRAYEQRVSNITTLEALASGLPQVFTDPHQVKQVLLNLIINAEQAMLTANGHGTLIARTWYDNQREMVVLEINDDGPGVPREEQTKIFDPFFTTKTVEKGTGLGLTVAYAIVQEHGGHIRVASKPGTGASFFVSFPAAASTRTPSPAPTHEPPETVAGSSVLVVEDETALAVAVADALTDAGYRVERAADGQEALERIAAEVFDLVICDLKMPRVDGPSFYRVLSDIKPALARHVIFVTGDVAGTDAEQFLIGTGCRWLPKPFRLNDLLQVAHDVLA